MEGKTLNIPSTIEDPSYRYKMPALQLRTEGRLNGVKTKIVNLEDVAKAIRVPPAYPLKFMGYELGTQLSESNMVINGDFKEAELRKLLDKFIEKYVLCPGCHYPEMVIKVKKEVITGGCNSCGWKDKLDNAHKLAAYIIKNPPKNVSEFKKDDKEKPKEETKEKEKEKEKEKDNSKKTSKKDKKAAEDKVAAEEEAREAAEKEKERKEKEEKAKEEHKPQPQLYDFKSQEDQLVAKIREVYKKHSAVESFEDQDAAIKDIIDAAKALEVPSEHKNKLSYLLFLAIFDLNIAKEISKNSAILKKAQEDLEIDAPEQDILMNLEKFLTIKNDFSVYEKFVPTILKFFYDDDLLTEEYLVEWYDGKHNSKLMMDYRFDVEKDKKFRQASKSFVEWLMNAETE